jgi:hypothetical protein
MLATILKSPMATATAIAIIDTFTQLRKLARTIDKVNEDAGQARGLAAEHFVWWYALDFLAV